MATTGTSLNWHQQELVDFMHPLCSGLNQVSAASMRVMSRYCRWAPLSRTYTSRPQTSSFMDLRTKLSLNNRRAVFTTRRPTRKTMENDWKCLWTILPSLPRLTLQTDRNRPKITNQIGMGHINIRICRRTWALFLCVQETTRLLLQHNMTRRSANGLHDNVKLLDCKISLGHNRSCDWSSSLQSDKFN